MRKLQMYLFLMSLFSFIVIPLGIDLQAQSDVNSIMKIIKNKKDYPNYYLVAAHRGYWANYPENSEGAYKAAIEIGADIVEMDVRLTSDDKMVVFHDACLNRVTTGSGRLGDEPYSYVQNLYLKMTDGTETKEKVLTLEDALDLLMGKAVVSIDIKETGELFNTTMIRVLQLLRQKAMLSQAIVKGKMTRSQLQQNVLSQVGLTLADFVYTPIAFPNTANLEDYIEDFVEGGNIYAFELVYKTSWDTKIIDTWVPYLKQRNIWVGQYSFWPETEYGVFAEEIPLRSCNPIMRNYNFLDKPDSPATAWDDGRGDWDWLFSKGADYVISDRGELLIDYLKLIGKRSK